MELKKKCYCILRLNQEHELDLLQGYLLCKLLYGPETELTGHEATWEGDKHRQILTDSEHDIHQVFIIK